MTQGHIEGIIVSGVGEAVHFTTLDWVQEQCRQKVGFIPYPGTLNLRIDPGQRPILDGLCHGRGIAIVPPVATFCDATAFPVSIGQIPAAVIVPKVPGYPQDIIEVIAPVKLKEVLAVDDGAVVTVIFND